MSPRVRYITILSVIALLLGACGSSSPGSKVGKPSAHSNAHFGAPNLSAPMGTGAIDRCLVGTWIDHGESDTLSYRGKSVAMNGLAGKTVAISASGAETVGFAHAQPLQGSVTASTFIVTESGTITDLVKSNAGLLSFFDINYTAFSETATLGAVSTFPPEPPPPIPVHYTCNATTLSLSGVGLRARFNRSNLPAASSGISSSGPGGGLGTGSEPGTGSGTFAVSASVTTAPPPTSATAIPDLFVYTAAIPPPGELFVWPNFPTSIQRDDNDWISGITWTPGSKSASGSGTFYTDLTCNGPAASCPPKAQGTVEFIATTPKTCTVTFANPTTGAQQSEQAYVYSHLQYTLTNSSQSSQIVTLPSPCE